MLDDPTIQSQTPVSLSSDTSSSPFIFVRPTDAQVKAARVLVVDSELATAKKIQRELAAAGFANCEFLVDVVNAMDVIRDTKPDLVLLDMNQPKSGLRILQDIKAAKQTFRLPVLAMTSIRDQYNRSMLLNIGANSVLQKPIASNELLAKVRNVLCEKVAFDEMAGESEKLRQDVLQDTLTGIANRRAFEFELNRKMLEWERQRKSFALFILDIDHFKRINDTFGHQVGDEVIKLLAKTVKKSMRDVDLPCRIGGEEFSVILPLTNREEASRAAERLRTSVEEMAFNHNDREIAVTVSIGIATTLNGDDSDLIYHRADSALYAAKQRGRNCSTFHDGSDCIPVKTSRQTIKKRTVFSESSDPLNVVSSKIVIIDNDKANCAIVKKFLRDAGFQRLHQIDDPAQANDWINREQPDLVLAELNMPGVSGIEILGNMRETREAFKTPVVFLTSSADPEVRAHALNHGASDFLNKPVIAGELVARVRNSLLAKAHVDVLSQYSTKLEQQVQNRTAELMTSRREAIQCLARAAELRDDTSGKHVLRVGRYAAIIATELGFESQLIIDLEHAAQLHDVGKLAVPEKILNKQGSLTEEEFEFMKGHCQTGTMLISDESIGPEDSIQNVRDIVESCNSPVMQLAALVAETHHEKWDGSGYPRGLAGHDIPIEGRITAICDVFDALSTARPYKEAFPMEECFRIIREESGKHFDPVVVQAFFNRSLEILEAYEELSD